jgi:hypothetical protein
MLRVTLRPEPPFGVNATASLITTAARCWPIRRAPSRGLGDALIATLTAVCQDRLCLGDP